MRLLSPQTTTSTLGAVKWNLIKQSALGVCWLFALSSLVVLPELANSSPQSAPPASWMSQVTALSGQAPRLNTAPLVQLDTSNKYYKTVIDGMMLNFKRAVTKASERAYTLNNATSYKPITVFGNVATNGQQQQQQKVSISDLRVDGINSPKVSNVYVNKKNVKLHVVFNFKTIKVTGRCSLGSSSPKRASSSEQAKQNNILLEATNWNTSWSANVMPMIGKDHFDLNRVYTSHGQQKLSLNLKDCPQTMNDKLKTALLDRVKTIIDNRLVEIMETVIIHTDTLTSSDDTAALSSDQSPLSPVSKLTPNRRGKRASKQLVNPLTNTSRSKKTDAPSTKARKTKDSSSNNGVKSTSNSALSQEPVRTKAKSKSKPKQDPIKRSPQKTLQKALKRTKRQTPCQQGEELDDYVDQLFRFGTRIVRAMEPISLPNATIELPDYNLKIFLYDGKGTRAYKFRRTKPAWVFCSNETISLGVTIEVEDLRVAYKYRVISGTRLIFDGDLEARLSPKAQAQFSQAVQEEDSEEPVQQRIDRVRLFRLGRVFVLIRGLGNLTQSLSMIINGYLNDNQEDLQPTFRMVEGDAVRLLNRFLANVNVPLLSVVAR